MPFILYDLRDRGGDWFGALRELVPDPPHIDPAISGVTREMVATWLEWGTARGLIQRGN